MLEHAIAAASGFEASFDSGHRAFSLKVLELVRKQTPDTWFVARVDHGVLFELPKSIGGLSTHDVLLAGRGTTNPPSTRSLEPLRSSTLCLHLGHLTVLT
jgi:hypothetical protein